MECWGITLQFLRYFFVSFQEMLHDRRTVLGKGTKMKNCWDISFNLLNDGTRSLKTKF